MKSEEVKESKCNAGWTQAFTKFRSFQRIIDFTLSAEGQARKSFYEALALGFMFYTFSFTAHRVSDGATVSENELFDGFLVDLLVNTLLVVLCYRLNARFDGRDFFFRCAMFGMFAVLWVMPLFMGLSIAEDIFARFNLNPATLEEVRDWGFTAAGWWMMLVVPYLFWRLKRTPVTAQPEVTGPSLEGGIQS